jgi:hypothetical protein
VERVRGEVENYKEFTALSERIVEVNEAICEARPASAPLQEPPARPAGEKGGSARSSRRRLPPR